METGIFTSQLYNSLNLGGPFISLFGKPLSKILAVDALDDYYQRSLQSPGENFSEQVLNAFNISLNYKPQDLLQIPRKGPAVIVANHPYGGIEGVLISALLEKVRPDVKIMANYLLKSIPELAERFIFVDPFEKEESRKRNIASMRETMRFVKNGGLLVIFPSGTVSHFHLKNRMVVDPAWKENIGRLIEKLEAPVIPVFFEGHNKAAFQTLGLIHPGLRTARLPLEIVNKANRSFNIFIGKSTPVHKLKQYQTVQDKLNYLRKRTYNLSNRSTFKQADTAQTEQKKETIAPALPIDTLIDEINNIPGQQILFEQKNAMVFYAHRPQIPALMQEIGRQREITFRSADEGTGRALDLDSYDNYYLHLIAWDRKAQKVIGAYRFGLADRIIKEFGSKGLYTSSLFHIKSEYFEMISPAIELGRSFICKEYQRSFSSLFLLWRGIGAFVALNPHYRYLFGPVSISNAYQPYSQRMMLEYLKTQHGNPHLSKMISAKNPEKSFRKKNRFDKKETAFLSELEDMITDLEDSFSGIPVLIRQYLKMGAEFIGFNRDNHFSSVLDGLIVVDLLKSEKKFIGKYFGKRGSSFFYEYHHLRNRS